MNLHNDLPEAMQLLMSYLKEHERKEIHLILADGFLKGTLDRAPNDPQNGFTLTHATRYSPKGERQELDQVLLSAHQILGWGGDTLDFLEARD